MNTAPKHVATRTGIDPSAWPHSQAIDGDALTWVRTSAPAGDRLFAPGHSAGFRFTTAEPNDAAGITTLTVLRREAEE